MPAPNKDRTITISTVLEESDLVPLFDGAGWAGTRVWNAAIWAIKFLVDEYITDNDNLRDTITLPNGEKKTTLNLCELGCGLGVPGMVWHLFGGNVVVTEQESIMSQLKVNVKKNFPKTAVNIDDNIIVANDDGVDCSGVTNETIGVETNGDVESFGTIKTCPLNWSRKGLCSLMHKTGHSKGFDIVLNCDCVYEPLYGKSWKLLVDVIDECLKINPNCLVITSVERRSADGVDDFLNELLKCDHVHSVEKERVNEILNLELYIAKGR